MRNSTVPQNSQSGAGELSGCSLGAKSSLLTVCGVYWTSATTHHLGSQFMAPFCAKITELSCDRDLIWHLRGTNKNKTSLIIENEKAETMIKHSMGKVQDHIAHVLCKEESQGLIKKKSYMELFTCTKNLRDWKSENACMLVSY